MYLCCVHYSGHLERKCTMQLLDPVGRFQTSPLLHNQPITERLQIFSYHNNIGVLYKGCLRYVRIQLTHIFTMVVDGYRLYSGMCGELIFSSDDFEGINVELWHSDSSIECIGMWTQQGIWIIRVSYIVILE